MVVWLGILSTGKKAGFRIYSTLDYWVANGNNTTGLLDTAYMFSSFAEYLDKARDTPMLISRSINSGKLLP